MASEVERAIEAIIMVTEEPIAPHLLAQILEVTPARVEELCAQLAESYVAEDRGFELVRVAGGYRFQSHPDLSGYVERFALEGQSSRLSAAALETLALVAYKQPVSRAQVAEVRGVSVDGVMRTLQHRGYVAEVARDTGPGQAILYGTTTRFLERLGIDSLQQLPPLAQFVPGPEVMDALDAGLRHGGAKSSPDAEADSVGDSDSDSVDAAAELAHDAERTIDPEPAVDSGRADDSTLADDPGSGVDPALWADPGPADDSVHADDREPGLDPGAGGAQEPAVDAGPGMDPDESELAEDPAAVGNSVAPCDSEPVAISEPDGGALPGNGAEPAGDPRPADETVAMSDSEFADVSAPVDDAAPGDSASGDVPGLVNAIGQAVAAAGAGGSWQLDEETSGQDS